MHLIGIVEGCASYKINSCLKILIWSIVTHYSTVFFVAFQNDTNNVEVITLPFQPSSIYNLASFSHTVPDPFQWNCAKKFLCFFFHTTIQWKTQMKFERIFPKIDGPLFFLCIFSWSTYRAFGRFIPFWLFYSVSWQLWTDTSCRNCFFYAHEIRGILQ